MVNVKSKGNRYQEKIEKKFQEWIDKYNQRYTEQRLWILETHGKDTDERPADFIIMRDYGAISTPILYVECKHVKEATNSLKRKWIKKIERHLNDNRALIVYKEHSKKEDYVIFDSHLGERPLKEWFDLMLEGR